MLLTDKTLEKKGLVKLALVKSGLVKSGFVKPGLVILAKLTASLVSSHEKRIVTVRIS